MADSQSPAVAVAYSAVLVSGSTTFRDRVTMWGTLDKYLAASKEAGLPEFQIFTGGANGADCLAEAWAVESGVRYTRVEAKWNKGANAETGMNTAGFDRNKELVEKTFGKALFFVSAIDKVPAVIQDLDRMVKEKGIPTGFKSAKSNAPAYQVVEEL